MRLFIQIRDGKPVEHPIIESNLKEVFPEVDIDNLPDWLANFVRIPQPIIDIYEVYEGCVYEWDGDIVKDIHKVRPMTEKEKIEKQNKAKEQWAQFGHASWVFDEALCGFVSPVPYPNDGLAYLWDETSISWVLR